MLVLLSKELARILTEEVRKIPTIPTSSKQGAKDLDQLNFIMEGIFLTFAVEACYPSINQHDSLQVLGDHVPVLNDRGSFWLKVLQLIVFNNYVQYDSTIFHQKHGAAMGTPVAPLYANLYLL